MSRLGKCLEQLARIQRTAKRPYALDDRVIDRMTRLEKRKFQSLTKSGRTKQQAELEAGNFVLDQYLAITNEDLSKARESVAAPVAESAAGLTVPEKPEGYFVKDGSTLRQVTLEQASKMMSAVRQESGMGGSELGQLKLYDADGKQIAYVSYNGKVWAGTEYINGVEPLYGKKFQPSAPASQAASNDTKPAIKDQVMAAAAPLGAEVATFAELLAPAIEARAKAFTGVSFVKAPEGEAGASLNPKTGELEIDIERLASHVNSVAVGSRDTMEAFLDEILREEVHHRGFVALYGTPDGKKAVDDVWTALPAKFKTESASAYFAARGGGKFDSEFQAKAEFFRQYGENQDFAARVERYMADAGLLGKWRKLLEAFLASLEKLRSDPQFAALVKQIEDVQAGIRDALERIQGVEASVEAALATPPSGNDAAYLAAVESGDMETAQRMVNQAAKAAGYNVGPFWRGSAEAQPKDGAHIIYLSKNKWLAGTFDESKEPKRYFVKAENILDAENEVRGPVATSSSLTPQDVQRIKGAGYDAVEGEMSGPGGHEIAVFSPSQIKSADPVTRDAQGNVIPLSQRFNPASDSILYTVPPPQKQQDDPMEAARGAATMPNAPDSESQARPLKDELGGAAADYPSFKNDDLKARAVKIVDSIGSLDQMARLLASEDGVRSLGLNPALQEYVQAEALKRAHAKVTAAGNDIERIRATQTMRKIRALVDVTGTESGQHQAARKLAGQDLRDEVPAMVVDTAIEKQQKATIDRAIPVEPVKEAIEKTATEAGPVATEALASKLDVEARGAAPVPPAEQDEKIKVLNAQIDAYFGGNTPNRVRVVHEASAEEEARLKDGVIEVNAAALSDPSTEDVARVLEHEIGHGLFSDPTMRAHFDALWNSLDKLQRAEIENYVAERYSAAERNEEASVRALDAIRAATRGQQVQGAWQKFVGTVTRLWQKFTGAMPKDAAALAARMVEVGVQRLRAGKAGRGLAMSKRSDLLKTDSPTLAKLLNTLRTKIAPGMKWRDIFTKLPSDQKQWELDVYARIRNHHALKALSHTEAVQLTRELFKAWQRERRKVFTKELTKQLAKVADVKPKAAKKVEASAPRLLQLINLGAFDSDTFRDAVAQEWGIENLSSVEAKRLKDIGIKMQEAPPGVARRRLAQQFVEGLQDLTNLTGAQVLDSWWTTAVLSGWRTMMDIGLGIANGIEDVALGSIATAYRTKNPDVIRRAIMAVFKNLPTALREARQHLRTGDRSMMRKFDADMQGALDEGQKLMSDVGRRLWDNGGLLAAPGGFMLVVGRLLTVLDHITASSTFEGSKLLAMAEHPEVYKKALLIGPRERANARAQARNELSGGRAPVRSSERVQEDARVKEILDQDVPTEIIAQATEIGQDASFQSDPSGLGYFLWQWMQEPTKLMKRAVEDVEAREGDEAWGRTALAALRMAAVFTPIITGAKFSRTLGGMLNRQLSYVPGLGLARMKEKNMRGAKLDILKAKQIYGSVVALAGLLWHFRDKDDDDEGIEGSWKGLTKDQRSQLYAQNKVPNSIWYRNAKGKIVSYNYLQWGIASILNTVGGMEDQRRYHGNADGMSVLVNGLATGLMAIGEKTQVQGLLPSLFGDSARSGGDVTDKMAERLNRWASNTVGGIVPRVFKDVDMVASPELRKPGDWWTAWAAQLPILRELSSGKRVNIFGENIKLDRGPLSRVVQFGTDDPAYQILGQMNSKGLWLPDPSTAERTVKVSYKERREMTEAEKDTYHTLTGEAYKKLVMDQGERILAMPPDEAKKFIQDRTEPLRDQAARRAVGR